MSYVDPFKSLNDIKRQEREALLNHPEFNQASRNSSPPVIVPPVISRRDYFAAAALQGLAIHDPEGTPRSFAVRCALVADALIEALDGEAKA